MKAMRISSIGQDYISFNNVKLARRDLSISRRIHKIAHAISALGHIRLERSKTPDIELSLCLLGRFTSLSVAIQFLGFLLEI